MYFLRGSLPWQGLHVHKGEDRYKKILLKKKSTSAEELCKGFPNEFVDYINYTRNLEFEADPDYKYLRELLITALKKQNCTYDFWYDWVSEKPDITDKVAVERYINNNTNVSLELKDDKKEKESVTNNDENIKENIMNFSKRDLTSSSASNNEGSNQYSSEVVKTNNAGINIPVDPNVTNDSMGKNDESNDKKDNKKNKDSKKKNKKDKGRSCLIY